MPVESEIITKDGQVPHSHQAPEFAREEPEKAITGPGSPPKKYSDAESRTTDLNNFSARRSRTSFTREQLLILEKEFERENYLPKSRRILLSSYLGLPDNTIKVWFQNRRMKNKRDKMMKFPLPYLMPTANPSYLDNYRSALYSPYASPFLGFPFPSWHMNLQSQQQSRPLNNNFMMMAPQQHPSPPFMPPTLLPSPPMPTSPRYDTSPKLFKPEPTYFDCPK